VGARLIGEVDWIVAPVIGFDSHPQPI